MLDRRLLILQNFLSIDELELFEIIQTLRPSLVAFAERARGPRVPASTYAMPNLTVIVSVALGRIHCVSRQ